MVGSSLTDCEAFAFEIASVFGSREVKKIHIIEFDYIIFQIMMKIKAFPWTAVYVLILTEADTKWPT